MSIYYAAGVPYSSELYHFGIKGQKWGVRRYQNLDRSLTPAGKERYGYLKSDYDSKSSVYDTAKANYKRSIEARDNYRIAKGARKEISKLEFSRAKNEYRNYGKKRQIEKNEINMRQAEWKRDKAKKKMDSFKGIATQKVSLVDPKLKYAGKKAVKSALVAAGAMTLGTIGTAAAASAYVAAHPFATSAVLTFLEINGLLVR